MGAKWRRCDDDAQRRLCVGKQRQRSIGISIQRGVFCTEGVKINVAIRYENCEYEVLSLCLPDALAYYQRAVCTNSTNARNGAGK